MRTTKGLLTELIIENCSIVMEHACSKVPLLAIRDKFEGEWRDIDKWLFSTGEMRADRALLELAVHMRALDDEEKLNEALPEGFTLGTVFKIDGASEPLYFRDMTNKVLHAARTEWIIDDPDRLKAVCHGQDRKRWLSAEIELPKLVSLCSILG